MYILKRALDYLGLEIRKTRTGKRAFPPGPFLAQKELLAHLTVNKPVIFDVGAHQGETVARYRTLFPAAEIYCFEPFATSARVLHERFCSDDSIKVIASAVSEKPGTMTFYVNEDDATNSLLPRASSTRRYFHSHADRESEVDVNVVSLDEFVADRKIHHLDILKLDIQGGELMALNGASNLLKNQNISLIYTEAMFTPHYEGSPLFHHLCTQLEKNGYTLFDIYDLYRARNGQLRFADALFVSTVVRKNVIDRYPAEP